MSTSNSSNSAAQSIAISLGGSRRAGLGWMALCPAHEDREPSLSISTGQDGKVLVHCFAGCTQGQVIKALRLQGLWDKNGRQFICPMPPVSEICKSHHGDEKLMAALAIWQASQPGCGTILVNYLETRKLNLLPASVLRFHPRLKHRDGRSWPAMVALVTHGATGDAIGIHRTFLASDGSGKAAVVPNRMMLGPCRGGAVRLAEPDDVLMVGEGLETCLAAMHATGKPAWAALSTSGMRALELRAEIHDIIVLADGDDPGEAVAQDCAKRWHREGRRVRIARPPRGLDFNDLLLGRTGPIEKTAP